MLNLTPAFLPDPFDHFTKLNMKASLQHCSSDAIKFNTVCFLVFLIVIREKRQILGNFVVTEATEAKRQVIDFNRSCLELLVIFI